jgi:class 3 adenylate cyclase/predicted ATPase
MKCLQCQQENPVGVKFCGACGVQLDVACPSCGVLNPPMNSFCHQCGQGLETATPPGSAGAPTRTADDPRSPTPDPAKAERRQLTVMFCDLVGSTALSERLDPEDMREIVRAYQEVCSQAILRFEGHVAQYLGDGLLVYFGYPVAHEDDAQRAIRAALGIVRAMEALNARLYSEREIRLAVRLGIHTGLVVVGQMGGGGRHERLALGETPNIAARLKALAEPDTAIISEATYRLLHGIFACRDLGFQPLKGVSTPMRAYCVLGERTDNRSEGTTEVGRTPLVGREQEVALILDRWEQVKEGVGQVVLLSGEPGIGKTRLLQVLKERIANEPHVRWECRCSPYHQDSAFHPVIELVQRALAFGRDDSAAEKCRKIAAGLHRHGLADAEALSLWASLLSVPVPEDHPPLNLTPQRQKQKTLEAILELLLALGTREPLLFIVEDLHWVDPSTLELLGLVIDQVATASVLVLLTGRPEFRPPWAPRAHVAQLMVNRFTRRQAEVMVGWVVGGKSLPAEVMRQVVAKTDGVPLFLEELTKMVVESGLMREEEDRYELTGALPPLAIPSTLQDSLMARLDRLAAVKDVAQVGAAIGRTFHYELLHAVASTDDATLQRALAKLGESDLLHQRGVPPDVTYIFKHALIQETAYQSMLVSRRQQLHRRIADTLVERFPVRSGTQPELVAHHYTEAGLTEQAIQYWQRAGERALQRSADFEAISHLTRGLEVLTTLPESRERAHRELSLQITLGPAVMNTGMWGSGKTGTGALQTTPGPARHILSRAVPDVEHVYVRACELARQVEDARQLFAALWGLYYLHQVRGQLQRATDVGEELLTLAQQLQDPELFVVAHRALGNSLFWRGELLAVHNHVKHALDLYDPQQMRGHAARYGQDAGVSCRAWGGLTLWLLGYPDQARQWISEALTYAQTLRHAFTLTQALLFSAILHQMRREASVARERAEAARALCTEHGFAAYLQWATILRGSALAAQGEGAEGSAEMRQGLAAHQAIARLPWLLFLGLLAEACVRAGQVEEGLRALDEAWEVMQTTEERVYEAELYRLKGELLLQQSAAHQGVAEEHFHNALTVARRQQAKSWELRAAMSLGRLWQQQGKRHEVYDLLAEVHGWFTEGFDTADLKDAQVLLAEVS